MQIQRVVHPIGQGAFYSERHNNFNMVYDCGEWKNSRQSTRVVQGSFEQRKDIGILFISHFDYDHVSKINILKKNFNIKKVVLPLLHEEEKIFLKRIYSNFPGFNKSFFELIENPSDYFGRETVIITVEEFEEKNKDREKKIELEKINEDIMIRSGDILKRNDWIYVPYNVKYSSRRVELENIFISKGLEIEKINGNVNYLTKNRKKITEAYNEVSGTINQNSMLVYSGPEKNNHDYKKKSSTPTCFNCALKIEFEERVACIYTGDANLKDIDISTIYSEYWENVGTLQIPHHGDFKSFDPKILDQSYYCIISVGNNNSYGHPSNQLVADISSRGSQPIIVTEDLQTIYIQNISK